MEKRSNISEQEGKRYLEELRHQETEEKRETLSRMESIGMQILCAARDELYLGMRFLDVALSSFSYQTDENLVPFGTDGAVMYFHPKQLGNLYRQNRILVNRAYLHMVYHCIFRHVVRHVTGEVPVELPDREGTAEGAVREKEAGVPLELRLWNVSCDIAVEHLIDGNQHRSVRFARSLLRRETYRRLEQTGKVLNAERVCRILQEWGLEEKELARLEEEFYVDDHRYWENQAPDRRQEPNLNKKWQDISEKIETDLETFSKEVAEKSGNLLGQLKVENRGRHDYREFLKKFSVLREEISVDPDAFDYSFYSYGLRLYGNMPLIEPQETREARKISEFVIVIDTSMSCSSELVYRFLEETYSVLSEENSFHKKVNIHLLQCDEQVHSDMKITNMEELKEYMQNLTLYGEGGTDFRPAFAYVEELIEKGEFENLRGLLYFTDGYGTYPQKMPPYKTAFVFMEEDYQDVDVPPWAIKLVLSEKELTAGKR